MIPVGIDTHAFRKPLEDDERQAWLARWAIDSECAQPPHILLTVGRLVPRKGVRWLVTEVLPRLAERRADWIYLVVGEGPERQAIAEAARRDQRVAQRVHLLGQISDDELRTAYAAADLFVMPNVPVPGDSEGFGIVHLEARAAGLPVVAADIEGISESFISGEDGWLVPAGDAAAFVDAIDRGLRPGPDPRRSGAPRHAHRGRLRLGAHRRGLSWCLSGSPRGKGQSVGLRSPTAVRSDAFRAGSTRDCERSPD